MPRLRRPKSPTAWFWAMIPYNAGVAASAPLTALFVTEILGGDVTTVGSLAAVTALAAVPAALLWGILIDRLGRRGTFIILGLLGFGIPTALIGISQNLPVVYLLTFVTSFVGLAVNPASTTLITEASRRDRWADAFASYNGLGGLGAIAGLIVGAVWLDRLPHLAQFGDDFAMRSLMILSGAAGVIGGLLAIGLLPRESGHRASSASFSPRLVLPPPRQLFASLGRDPWALYVLAYFFVRLATNLALTPYAVFLKDDLKASAPLVFVAYLLNQAIPTVCYRPMGLLLRRIGAVRLMMLVNGGRSLGLLFGLLAALAGPGWLGLGLATILYGPVIGISWAGIAVAGSVAAMEMIPPEQAGRGMGVYNGANNLSAIVGAYLSGIGVVAIGYGGIFAIATVVGVLGAAGFLLVRPSTPPVTARALD